MTKTQANEPGFVLANEAKPDPRIAPLAKALEAKRAELIAQPLSFIWNDLAKVAVDLAPPVPSPAYGGVREALEPFAMCGDILNERDGWDESDTLSLFTTDDFGDADCLIQTFKVRDLRRARTAYDALSVAVGEADYVLVPREPTREMLDHAQDVAKAGAGMSWNGRSPQMMFAQAWSAMLAAAPSPSTLSSARHPDDLAVDAFALDLKAKLAEARAKGKSGWQDHENCSQQFLSDELRSHALKTDPLDVANFAMFLHQRGEPIAPPSSTHTAAGAGPVGEAASVWKVEQLAEQICLGGYPEDMRRELEERKNPTYWLGLPEKTREQHRRSARTVMALYARPVEESGEVERLTRERDRATGLWRGASERAERAEAALAEAQERLEKALAYIEEAIGCFDAAYSKGMAERLAEAREADGFDPASAAGIFERRVSFVIPALELAREALTGDAQVAK